MTRPATQSVFALLHPTTGTIGYIGVSSAPDRYASRLYARARSDTPQSRNDGAKNMELATWLADLPSRPDVRILERDLPTPEAKTRRRELIAELKPGSNTYLRPDFQGVTR